MAASPISGICSGRIATCDSNGRHRAPANRTRRRSERPIHKTWPGLVELLLAGAGRRRWCGSPQRKRDSPPRPPGRVGAGQWRFSTHFRIDQARPFRRGRHLSRKSRRPIQSVSATLRNSAANFRYRTDVEATTIDHTGPFPAYVSWPSMNFTEHFVASAAHGACRDRLARGGPFYRCACHNRTPTGALAIDIPEACDRRTSRRAAFAASGGSHRPATRYDAMPSSDALHNPSAYAAFAQHVAIGSDTRFGDANHGPE